MRRGPVRSVTGPVQREGVAAAWRGERAFDAVACELAGEGELVGFLVEAGERGAGGQRGAGDCAGQGERAVGGRDGDCVAAPGEGGAGLRVTRAGYGALRAGEHFGVLQAGAGGERDQQCDDGAHVQAFSRGICVWAGDFLVFGAK